VRANEGGENGGEDSHDDTRAHESERHAQDASSQGSLKQMRESFIITTEERGKLILICILNIVR